MRSITTVAKAMLLIIAVLACVPSVHAQTNEPAVAQPEDPAAFEEGRKAILASVRKLQEEVKIALEAAAVSLGQLRTEVDDAASVDATLALLKIKADEVTASISTAIGELENRYNLVAKRLEEIAEAPADGAPAEDQGIASDRKRLQDEKAQMNAIITDADALKTEATHLSSHITDLRRKLFTETLFRHTELDQRLFDDTVSAIRTESGKLVSRTSSALEFVWAYKRQALLISLGIILATAIVVLVLVRWAFEPLIRRDRSIENPLYTRRLSLAFWSSVIPSFATAVVVVVGLLILVGFNVLREDMAQILKSVLWVVVGILFLWRLARGIVAPARPQWRLIDVSDQGARLLVGFALVLGVINGISYIVAQTNIALDSPVVLTVAEGFLSSILIGLLLILLSFVRPMRVRDGRDGSWPKLVRSLLILTGCGLILTTLFGYIGLAQFASTQIVVTGALAVTMYVGFLSGHAISRHDVFAETIFGKWLGRRYKFDAVRLDQIGLLVGLLVYLLVCLFGLPLIMLKWGFNAADIIMLFAQLFTEIKVGNITISLVGIVVGILMFFGGYFATKWFQRWLDGNVLARSQVDVGVRNSVNTILGYIGIGIACVIGISAAGINLSSLAFVAGGLSLGVGFGLQTIVQNFVSGLILLGERPFKVGDWIVAGTAEGFVRRISVRATEIETFRQQSVIVPNSQLINATVGNWTLRNNMARSEIPVSVSYDSDPRQVMDILMEIANRQPLIMTMPGPFVEFVRFGDSSLDFELRFYLADLFDGLAVRNEVRCEIFERFKKEGISMPFPQRTVSFLNPGDAAKMADASTSEEAGGEDGFNPEEAKARRRKEAAGLRDIDAVEDDHHSHDRYGDGDHDDR